MNHRLSVLTLTAFLLLTAACSGNKPPELAATRSKNTLTTMRELGKAYEQRNLTAFMADVAPGFRDREAFSASLAAVFQKYETIHFTIQYAKMLIMIADKGEIKASFNWDGEWFGAGGVVLKNGGRITLVLEPGSFKLLSIDGKNPFIPQQGEMPGGKP